MVGRNWFTISKAAIISLIIVNFTLRDEEEKKRENKGCICRSCKQKFYLNIAQVLPSLELVQNAVKFSLLLTQNPYNFLKQVKNKTPQTTMYSVYQHYLYF